MQRTVAVRLALLVALAATSLRTASAQTYRQINVPADYPTIQAAIAAATSGTATQTGDTILVAPGNHPENLDFQGKSITVQATSSDPTQTTITGTDPTRPTVQFITGEGRFAILQGFTLTGGGGSSSGAAGGVYIHSATPTLRGNIITRNTCFGVYSEGGSPAILGNQINNTLYTAGAPCNTGAGSAIWLDNAGGPLIASSKPLILGNTIQQNTASGLSPGGGGGAAILVQNVESPVIQNNLLLNNTTTGAGGAIQITGASFFYLAGNLIVGNQSAAHGAVAIMIPTTNTGLGVPASLIINNTITGNTVVPVGTAAPDDASELYLEGDLSRTVLAGNIIAGSSSTLPAFACGLISDSLSPIPPVLDHNDITNTQSAGGFGGSTLCTSQAGVTGNLSVDPAFVSTNPASADFHLRAGSPAIDAGITSATADLLYNQLALLPDLDGNPRILDSTSVGYPVIDLGAYEAQGSDDAGITVLALTSSSYDAPGGSTVNLTANVYTSAASTPPGPVVFSEDGQPFSPNSSAPTTTATPNGPAAVFTTPPLVPGLHTVTATIPAQNGTSPATAVKAFVLVDPYTTQLTLTCPASPAVAGAPLSFGITLTSANGPPPGATVTLFDNGSTTPFDTVQLTPAGTYTYTTSSLAVGPHSIVAVYAGTALYQAASSAPCAFTVTAAAGAPTVTTVAGNPNPAAVGQVVTFTVQVTNTAGPTPVPAGSVTLTAGNTVLAPSQTLSATGSASFSISTLPLGTNTVTATFTPTSPSAFAPSSGSTTETIVNAPSVTTLTAAPNPANALSPVLLTATITAATGSGTPTGTVNFFDGATLIGTSPVTNRQATLTASFSANPPSHPLTAVYSGDSAFATSTSVVVLELINAIATSTTLTVAPAQSVAFQPVSLSTHTGALTPGAPPINSSSGTAPSVTFFSNGVIVGTAPVDASGNTSLTITPPAGSYIITAVFSGSAVLTQSASNAVTLSVIALAPALTLTGSPADAVVGQTVNLTASLTALGAPPAAITGTVSFFDNGSPIGSAGLNASGVAGISFSPSAPGTQLITAHYSGNTTLTPADASLTLNVSARDFVITTSTPSISIRTEHHAPLIVTVTSLGGLVDTVDLSCGNLPQWTSCAFAPAGVGIGQAAGTDGQSAAAKLTLDTDFVLGYAKLDAGAPPTRSHGPAPIAFALLLPAAVLLFWRRRDPLPRLLLLVLLSAATLTVSGCSGLYPPHTAPGTYTLVITGHAENNNITRSTTLTLVVTP